VGGISDGLCLFPAHFGPSRTYKRRLFCGVGRTETPHGRMAANDPIAIEEIERMRAIIARAEKAETVL